MNSQDHWQNVYQSRTPAQTSWFQPHLQASLEWIAQAKPDRSASILDVGSGESTLVDDLLAAGYTALTILDIAPQAIERSRQRLGPAAASVHWIAGDITQTSLPPAAYDLWHDRAVFHFLTEPGQRVEYIRQLTQSLKPDGHLIIATFGPQGPEKCSGLPTMRYDAQSLSQQFSPAFRLIRSAIVAHTTPFGTEQQFLYCHLARIA
jgi:SAM-dependent methyltransferase